LGEVKYGGFCPVALAASLQTLEASTVTFSGSVADAMCLRLLIRCYATARNRISATVQKYQTEVTIGLTWIPYGDDDKSYFREVVSIEPLKTGQVSIRLGTQLPPDTYLRFRNKAPVASQHWSWLLANARGVPAVERH